MKYKNPINKAGYLLFLMLMSVVFAQPALAVCVQSDPEADVVFAVDANNGCDSINDHYGCSITSFKGGMGSCTYVVDPNDPQSPGFTTTAYIDSVTGGLTWSITQLNVDSPVGIDVSVTGGGFKGNNCGYTWFNDVFSGSGGDCKVLNSDGSCATFQNITSLDVCADLVEDVPPPPPPVPPVATTLNNCQPDLSIPGELDETGIICPTYDDPLDPNFGKQKPVIVCNLELDRYAFGTIGANDANSEIEEDVCCKCGVEGDTACFISSEKATNLSPDGKTDLDTGCTVETTTDPTQEVILQFQKDRGSDPCEKIVSGGKVYKTCW